MARRKRPEGDELPRPPERLLRLDVAAWHTPGQPLLGGDVPATAALARLRAILDWITATEAETGIHRDVLQDHVDRCTRQRNGGTHGGPLAAMRDE